MEVEYSDKPKWGQLTVPNFHGPFALHFLMLCFAMLVWLAEMAQRQICELGTARKEMVSALQRAPESQDQGIMKSC